MTARPIALCAALSLMIGCGSHHSQYTRYATSPGELVWRYDNDHLQVTRDGKLVAEASAWAGLAPAVTCVPLAEAWATDATARHRSGTVMLWTGWIGALASVGVGTALIVSDVNDSGRVLTGFTISLGGLLAGMIVGLIGGQRRMKAEARGIDAVNLYNDQLAHGSRCTPAS